MITRNFQVFFICFTLLIGLINAKSLKKRKLEVVSTDFLFKTSPITTPENHEFTIISTNHDCPVSKIISLNILENNNEIICAFKSVRSLAEEDKSECILNLSEEVLTFSLEIKEKTVYKINQITYEDDSDEKQKHHLSFEDEYIPIFRINSNTEVLYTEDALIVNEKDESVIIDFIPVKEMNSQIYINSKKLICESKESSMSCIFNFDGKPKLLTNIEMKLNNIYYTIKDIEILTYQKVDEWLKDGITIKSISSLDESEILAKDINDETLFTFVEESVSQNEQQSPEGGQTEIINTKKYVISSKDQPKNGICHYFTLKQNNNYKASFLKELAPIIIVNTISQVIISSEPNRDKSNIYFLFEQPIFETSIISSISLEENKSQDTTIESEEVKTDNQNIEVSSCSIGVTNYSLKCSLSSLFQEEYSSIKIKATNSFIINISNTVKIQVQIYDSDITILKDANLKYVQINKNKNIFFNLNIPTTTLPELKFAQYLSETNEYTIKKDNLKLSLDGMKLSISLNNLMNFKEGLYNLIYGISFKDIFLFYNNEIELEQDKISLPAGNRVFQDIIIKLKKRIIIEQIISIKYNNEYLSYTLSNNSDGIIVHIPKDFSVKKANQSYTLVITDFNNNKYSFSIDIREAPLFTFSQTFFIENSSSQYSIDVTLGKTNSFKCELKISDKYDIIDEKETKTLTFHNSISINYRVLDYYEYNIFNIDINENIFAPIDQCLLTGKDYIIEPKLFDYYALDFSQNDFTYTLEKTEESKNIIIDRKSKYEGKLDEGEYKLYYYYKDDDTYFTFLDVTVSSPQTPEYLFIDDKLFFDILNIKCALLPSNENNFYLLKALDENTNKIPLSCQYSNLKYTCSLSEGSSIDQGYYNVYWNDFSLGKEIVSYTPIKDDDLDFTQSIELESGVYNLKITLKTKTTEAAETTQIDKDFSQIKTLVVTKQIYPTISPDSQKEELHFDNTSFVFDKDKNQIVLSIEIEPKYQYQLTKIVLKDDTTLEKFNQQSKMLPIYSSNDQYIFINTKNIQFTISIIPPIEDVNTQDELSPYGQSINLVINKEIKENACTKLSNNEDSELIYQCSYELKSLTSQTLSFKSNIQEDEDKYSTKIQLIRYELNEENKCFNLLQQKIFKLKVYSTEELFKTIFIFSEQFLGRVNEADQTIEYEIDMTNIIRDEQAYSIYFKNNEKQYTINNEHIIIFNENKIESISPSILSLSTFNTFTIKMTYPLKRQIEQEENNYSIKLRSDKQKEIECTCTQTDSTLTCSLPVRNNEETNSILGNYISLEYIIDKCTHSYPIDFTIDSFSPIPSEFSVNYLIEQEKFKVTLNKADSNSELDLNTINTITFNNHGTSNQISFCKEGCESTFTIEDGNSHISFNLPLTNGNERYSLIEIKNDNNNFKKYKNYEILINDYSLLTEVFAIEEGSDDHVQIILDFYEKEIAKSRQNTITIGGTLRNCNILNDTKLECIYSFSSPLLTDTSITLKSRDNDPLQKTIYILAYKITNKCIPIQLDRESGIDITFEKFEPSLTNVKIYFNDEDTEGTLVTFSSESINNINLPFSKFTNNQEYKLYIGKDGSTNKVVFTTIDGYSQLTVTKIDKNILYNTDKDVNMIISFNRDLNEDEIMAISFTQKSGEETHTIDCTILDSIEVNNNQLICGISNINDYEGEFKLKYFQCGIEIETNNSISIKKNLITSITPQIIQKSDDEVTIAIAYSDTTILSQNDFSIQLINIRNSDITIEPTITDCQSNLCSLTFSSLNEGEYKIKISYTTTSNENDSSNKIEFTSEEIIIVYLNEVAFTNNQLSLTKGINKDPVIITLTHDILESQIEKITFYEDELLYNLKYSLIPSDEQSNKYKNISISFDNILFIQKREYDVNIYIKTANQDTSPIIAKLTIDEKYKLNPISKQRIQIGVDKSFDIIYTKSFEENEKPTGIELRKDNGDHVTFLFTDSNIEINQNTIKCKLDNIILHQEGIYIINTIFDKEFDYYDFNDNEIYIAAYLSPTPKFSFNRHYVTIRDDNDNFEFKITLETNNDEIQSIKTKETTVNHEGIEFSFSLSPSNEYYSFEYYIENNYKFPIDGKVLITTEKILSFNTDEDSKPSKCNYYNKEINVKIKQHETITIDDKYKSTIKVMLVNDQQQYELIRQRDGLYSYIGDKEKLKGKQFNLEIIENDDFKDPLDKIEESIIFTDVSFPSYAYINSIIPLEIPCPLANLQLVNNQYIYPITLQEDLDLSNISLVDYGEYSIKDGNIEVGKIMIYNNIQDAKFNIKIPTILSYEEPITITIQCNKKEFNMNMISEVHILKNIDENIKIDELDKKDSSLSFKLSLERGNIYTITAIKRKKEIWESNLIDSSLIKTFPEEEQKKIITETFKLINEHYFGFKDEIIKLDLIIYPDNNSNINLQKEGEEELQSVNEETLIKIESSSIYIIKDETTNFSKKIYISMIEEDNEYPLCHTVIFSGMTSILTGFKLTLTSPIQLEDADIPILYLNKEIITRERDVNDKYKIHYSINIKKDSPYIDIDNILSLQYKNKQPMTLSKGAEFYSYYKVKDYKGILREKKDNQNFIVSFINDVEEVEISLSSKLEEVAETNECIMMDKNTFECTIDLSNVSEGKYYLSYKSKCDETIKLQYEISVYNESTLPFDFKQIVYLIPENPSEPETSFSIEVNNLEPNINYIHLYYREKDSNNDYEELKLNEDNTVYSIDISNPSEGEYEFAYSYMINGDKVPISKTIKIVKEGTKGVLIDPEPSSCYYIQESISFTITPIDPNKLQIESINATLTLTTENESQSISLVKNGNRFTIPNNIQAGKYSLEITDNSEDTFFAPVEISFTDIKTDEFYYKSSIIFETKCPLNSLSIELSSNSTIKSKLDCKGLEDSTDCSFPSSITSFGEFKLYSGNSLVSTINISKEISESTFFIKKKAQIDKGDNIFYLMSNDFDLTSIATITLNDNLKLDNEGENKFYYNPTDNRIEFTVRIEDPSKELIITEISRKALFGEQNENNLSSEPYITLTTIEKCKDGQIISSLNLCEHPKKTEDNQYLCNNNLYCKNNGTCTIINSLPKCECPIGYYGIQCSLVESNINNTVDEIIGNIFSEKEDNPNNIKAKEPIDYYQARTISMLIIQHTEAVIDHIGNRRPEFLTKATNQVQIDRKKIKPPAYSFELIHCSILIQIHHIRLLRRKLRNLEEISKEEQQLKDLIKLSHELYTDNIYEGGFTNYINETSIDGNILHQGWINTKEGTKEYSQVSFANKIMGIDISQCKEANDNVNFQTNLLIDSLSEEASNEEKSVGIYFTSLDSNGEKFDLSSCKNTQLSIVATSIPNSELGQLYSSKGIDIYNPKDPAFQEPCYISDNFDYDLTQKYRRQNIYQNQTFKIDGCNYDHVDYTNNKIYFSNCSISEVPLNFYIEEYPLSKDNIDIEHVDNLPTKCGGDVENIQSNIAFWMYLILFILLIIFDVVFGITSKKKLLGDINSRAISNDLQIETHKHFNQVATTEANLKAEDQSNKVVAPSEIKISVENKSFSDIIVSNFKSLHPLLSLCHVSLFSPTIFTSWVFVYNIFNLFGFNALYFNETMLEDRITDSYRDNFGYPMKTEFEKIISAIVTSIALNIIVRAITIVTYSQKENLVAMYKPGDNNEKVINDFINSMLIRRIIAGVFMLALNIFFFYYTIVFCGIYVNAQYGWFYSGIWSLFWVWICFAPIYILLISVIENAGNSQCAYYMKRLFIF